MWWLCDTVIKMCRALIFGGADGDHGACLHLGDYDQQDYAVDITGDGKIDR